jgi:hypothetical protein
VIILESSKALACLLDTLRYKPIHSILVIPLLAMASRAPAARPGAGGRFAQFKLVLLGTSRNVHLVAIDMLTDPQVNLQWERYCLF